MKAPTTYLLAFLLMIMPVFDTAEASVRLWGNPLKLVTCEVLLKSSLEDFSQKQNILPVLRDAIGKFSGPSVGQRELGRSFENMTFDGSLDQLTLGRRQRIAARLSTIERELLKTNMDVQMVTLEVRGRQDIAAAVIQIEESEVELRSAYNREAQRIFSRWVRIGTFLFSYVTVQMTYTYLQDVIAGLINLDSTSTLGLVGPAIVVLTNYFAFFYPAYRHNAIRFDWQFETLKDVLRIQALNPNAQKVFVQSTSTEFPVEFHKMLLSDQSEGVQEARQTGLARWGSGYTVYLFNSIKAFFKGTNTRREISNAGDRERNIYMDNIVFYDEVAKEPVWIFVYRAYRNLPMAHKPPPKVIPAPAVREVPQWAPDIQPSAIR